MLVCWVACPIFLVTTDVCFMRHAKCQVSSCSELKVTHGIPWSRIPFRILVISYKHPSKQTVESKRWRHPGLIERSSDQDVQCLWPSGGMVSCSEGHGQCRVPFDPQVIPSRATIWAAAFELGCSIWEENFWSLQSRCVWCPQVWWPPEDLRRVLHLNLRCFLWCDEQKSFNWRCVFLLGLESWKLRFNLSAFNHYRTGLMLRPQSNDAAVFFSEKSRGWQDGCGHGTCRR